MRQTINNGTAGRRRGMILGGLLMTGLGVGVFAPFTAGASSPTGTTAMNQGQVHIQGWHSSAFKVENLSPYTLRQTDVASDIGWETANTPPANGTVIAPGERVHYEAKTSTGVGRKNSSTITYDVLDGAGKVIGTVKGQLLVYSTFGEARISCETTTGAVICANNRLDTISVQASDVALSAVGLGSASP